MRLPTIRTLFLSMVAVLVLAGCDDSVNPFVEEDRFFSVYGYLDTASDEQFVRVIPLRTDIAFTDAPIDARVFTTERESGLTTEWQDSLVTFSDGSTGHVFHAGFRPIPGWTYDLVVERSDGIQSRASTTIPVRTDVEISAPVLGSQGFAAQRVTWSDIDFKPFRVEVWYRFLGARPSDPFQEAIVVYDDLAQRIGSAQPGGLWQVLVSLSGDKEDVTDYLGISNDARPQLLGIGMRLTMSNSTWRPPGGVFDREVLVQPGTFSNVENGFGFFGSVNQYTVEWVLSPSESELAGYTFPGKR